MVVCIDGNCRVDTNEAIQSIICFINFLTLNAWCVWQNGQHDDD